MKAVKIAISDISGNSKSCNALIKLFTSEKERYSDRCKFFYVTGDTGSGKSVNLLLSMSRLKYTTLVAEPINSPIQGITHFVNQRKYQDGIICESGLWKPGFRISPEKFNSIQITNYNKLLLIIDKYVKKVIYNNEKCYFILDEIHEGTPLIDFSFLVLFKLVKKYTNLNLIISSACKLESRFVNKLKTVGFKTVVLKREKKLSYNVIEWFILDFLKNIEGARKFTIQMMEIVKEFRKNFETWFGEIKLEKKEDLKKRTIIRNLPHNAWVLLSKFLLEFIHTEKKSCLVFLPGITEIEKLKNLMKGKINKNSKLILCEVHSRSIEDYSTECKNGEYRLVLATNSMESGKTIPGIQFIFDLCLEKLFYKNNFLYCTERATTICTSPSIDQRKGRTGRTCSGVYVRFIKNIEFLLKKKDSAFLRMDYGEVSSFGRKFFASVLNEENEKLGFKYHKFEKELHELREKENIYFREKDRYLWNLRTKLQYMSKFWMDRSNLREILMFFPENEVIRIYEKMNSETETENFELSQSNKNNGERPIFFGGEICSKCNFLDSKFVELIFGFLNFPNLVMVQAKENEKYSHFQDFDVCFKTQSSKSSTFDYCNIFTEKEKSYLRKMLQIPSDNTIIDLGKLCYKGSDYVISKCTEIVDLLSRKLKSEVKKKINCEFINILRGNSEQSKVTSFDKVKPEVFFTTPENSFGIVCTTVLMKVSGIEYSDVSLIHHDVLLVLLLGKCIAVYENMLFFSFPPFFSIICLNKNLENEEEFKLVQDCTCLLEDLITYKKNQIEISKYEKKLIKLTKKVDELKNKQEKLKFEYNLCKPPKSASGKIFDRRIEEMLEIKKKSLQLENKIEEKIEKIDSIRKKFNKLNSPQVLFSQILKSPILREIKIQKILSRDLIGIFEHFPRQFNVIRHWKRIQPTLNKKVFVKYQSFSKFWLSLPFLNIFLQDYIGTDKENKYIHKKFFCFGKECFVIQPIRNNSLILSKCLQELYLLLKVLFYGMKNNQNIIKSINNLLRQYEKCDYLRISETNLLDQIILTFNNMKKSLECFLKKFLDDISSGCY